MPKNLSDYGRVRRHDKPSEGAYRQSAEADEAYPEDHQLDRGGYDDLPGGYRARWEGRRDGEPGRDRDHVQGRDGGYGGGGYSGHDIGWGGGAPGGKHPDALRYGGGMAPDRGAGGYGRAMQEGDGRRTPVGPPPRPESQPPRPREGWDREHDVERMRREGGYPGHPRMEHLGGEEMPRQAVAKGRGPKGYKRPDATIHDDVCMKLADADVGASDVTVRVENGEVHLGGTVHSRAEKKYVEDLCEIVRGVADVHNALRIASRDSEERGASGHPTEASNPATKIGSRMM
jgi:hypothetical protein